MSVANITNNTEPIEDLTKLDAPTLINEAKYIFELIESNWKAGKKHKYVTATQLPISVQTYSNNKLNDSTWHARSYNFSEFGDPLKERYFHELMQYVVGSLTDLKFTHTEYEKKYIEMLYDYELTPFELPGADPNSITYLAQLYYKFPFPLKKRVFYELVHVHKESEHEAYVLSLAVNPKNYERPGLDANFVVGTYTSIEKVSYDPETKHLNWIMATCSNPGGHVPHWFAHANLGSAIAKDVPAFVDWVDGLKAKEALHSASPTVSSPPTATQLEDATPVASPSATVPPHQTEEVAQATPGDVPATTTH